MLHAGPAGWTLHDLKANLTRRLPGAVQDQPGQPNDLEASSIEPSHRLRLRTLFHAFSTQLHCESASGCLSTDENLPLAQLAEYPEKTVANHANAGSHSISPHAPLAISDALNAISHRFQRSNHSNQIRRPA